MKTFLIGLIVIFSSPAGAAPDKKAAEFVSRFVQRINDRLEDINAKRTIEGSRPYCSQLSDEQISEIESIFAYRKLHQVPAKQFITVVSENLHCYPLAWFPGRSSIGGLLFNTKAYVMDHTLVRETLESLAGRSIENTDTLDTLALF